MKHWLTAGKVRRHVRVRCYNTPVLSGGWSRVPCSRLFRVGVRRQRSWNPCACHRNNGFGIPPA